MTEKYTDQYINQLNEKIQRVNSDIQRKRGSIETAQRTFKKGIQDYEERYGIKLTIETLQSEYEKETQVVLAQVEESERLLQQINDGTFEADTSFLDEELTVQRGNTQQPTQQVQPQTQQPTQQTQQVTQQTQQVTQPPVQDTGERKKPNISNLIKGANNQVANVTEEQQQVLDKAEAYNGSTAPTNNKPEGTNDLNSLHGFSGFGTPQQNQNTQFGQVNNSQPPVFGKQPNEEPQLNPNAQQFNGGFGSVPNNNNQSQTETPVNPPSWGTGNKTESPLSGGIVDRNQGGYTVQQNQQTQQTQQQQNKDPFSSVFSNNALKQ